MTRVIVNPGVCGMSSTIEVSRVDRKQVSLRIETGCDIVREIGDQLALMELRYIFKSPAESIVYEYASKAGAHYACPIPMAILKAAEVETGMALPRPVSLAFEPVS